MGSKNITATIISLRISYSAKQQLQQIAENATVILQKEQGQRASIVSVSDVIRNAIQEVYGVNCG